jgi:hypothetical protein
MNEEDIQSLATELQPLYDQFRRVYGRHYDPGRMDDWADWDELFDNNDDVWSQSSQESGLVIAFDFDGVLAIPYSQPEVLFAGTEALLRDLWAMGHTLIVCSFNPRAYAVLKPLMEEGIISAIRAGSCVRWWEDEEEGGLYKDATHRHHMEKRLQIASMLGDELCDLTVEHLVFIDDDMRNIDNVANSSGDFRFPVTTRHVPWYAGVGWATMDSFLNAFNENNGPGDCARFGSALRFSRSSCSLLHMENIKIVSEQGEPPLSQEQINRARRILAQWKVVSADLVTYNQYGLICAWNPKLDLQVENLVFTDDGEEAKNMKQVDCFSFKMKKWPSPHAREHADKTPPNDDDVKMEDS